MQGTSHETVVAAWLGSLGDERAGNEQLVQALTAALCAVWNRARPSLGDVLLTTLARRALRAAERRNEALAALGLRVGERGELTVAHASDPSMELRDGVACALVELLRALAAATGDALTPALHATLRSAAVDPPPAHSSVRPGAARDELARQGAR